ncbi:MAG: 1-acyl-sn-glycerol-3-phosphate acyltransferase, partial [Clostridia bacterium]|nr:1-acyl-sn-glycerol-3-phosphate acyltransferase [Clostridia bacterium]
MHGFVHWFIKITGWIPFGLAFRNKTYYEDKKAKPSKVKGKAIIVSNHYSVWDYPALMFAIPGRTLRCQVAELMFRKNPFMTLLMKAMGAVKVDRDTHNFAFIEKSEKILNKGGTMLIFPESRIPRPEEEKPLPFKPSAVMIALETGAPVIPVAVNGSYFNKRPSRVLIGKPIDLSEWYDVALSKKENVARINDRLRDKVVELKHELEKREKEEKE